MATENIQDRSQLHHWIDDMPPRQFDLVYRLVEELLDSDRDDTEYLLSSNEMTERLLVARNSSEGIP
jgi:hypothetical protein